MPNLFIYLSSSFFFFFFIGIACFYWILIIVVWIGTYTKYSYLISLEHDCFKIWDLIKYFYNSIVGEGVICTVDVFFFT